MTLDLRYERKLNYIPSISFSFTRDLDLWFLVMPLIQIDRYIIAHVYVLVVCNCTIVHSGDIALSEHRRYVG